MEGAVKAFFIVFLTHSVIEGALENTIPAKGRCFANSTHWGDEIGIEKLPPCWKAFCGRDNSGETITLRTPCSLGFDIEHTREGKREMLHEHCYPSNRGELPGEQCCGGYKICAHAGENIGYFNVINFFTFRNNIIYQPWFISDDSGAVTRDITEQAK